MSQSKDITGIVLILVIIKFIYVGLATVAEFFQLTKLWLRYSQLTNITSGNALIMFNNVFRKNVFVV